MKEQFKNIKSVQNYCFGNGSLSELESILDQRKALGATVYYVDLFFKDGELIARLPLSEGDKVVFVDSKDEPSTTFIDSLVKSLKEEDRDIPRAVVGIGGGCCLDTAKAVSNLLGNPGEAADYQGWNLLKRPGVYKIGIPTLSGTGSETSRTCVLTNEEKGIKLGMNSDFTMFDQLILDPNLTKTVSRMQYFYTGMDTYLHSMEYLNGRDRSPLIDAYAEKSIELCREVFLSDDMMSDEAREKIMISSFFGGSAAGTVGLIHPFSAGLSIANHTHHCLANCIVMNVMGEYYPKEFNEFMEMMEMQNIVLPKNVFKTLSDQQKEQLYKSSICHNKPLSNALGDNYASILTPEKVLSIFSKI